MYKYNMLIIGINSAIILMQYYKLNNFFKMDL